jgi:hypothetical protein
MLCVLASDKGKSTANPVIYGKSSDLCSESHRDPPKVVMLELKKREVEMNFSIYGADLRTHLKIVVVALLFANVVAGIGRYARITDIDLGTAPLVKAGQPAVLTGALPVIR